MIRQSVSLKYEPSSEPLNVPAKQLCLNGERQVHSLTGHSRDVNVVAFSADGKRVVSGSDDRLVKIWDNDTGAEVRSFAGVC